LPRLLYTLVLKSPLSSLHSYSFWI
jgi:hypothetical protein